MVSFRVRFPYVDVDHVKRSNSNEKLNSRFQGFAGSDDSCEKLLHTYGHHAGHTQRTLAVVVGVEKWNANRKSTSISAWS